MTTVISAEGLGKKYLISHQPKQRYTTLRDVLAARVRYLTKDMFHPFSRTADAEAKNREEFWALHDINFEIREGDRVGIIGRNGAGKSTLLKILSRITEPSKGRVKIKGRVASLLEVGTGFHPELTGRENIFLNGAILGMSKSEISRKFDEIVAFAEVEKFIDTPVKRYSSGMYVRLAFAVAAHLEPEILIVDEVLAVGDAQFQKKCLGRMEHVGMEGRTVLFVSHNTPAVLQLCNQALWLKDGKIAEKGGAADVVTNYLVSQIGKEGDGQITAEMHNHSPVGLTFERVAILNNENKETRKLLSGETMCVVIDLTVNEQIKPVRFGVVIHTIGGIMVAACHHTDLQRLEPGNYKIKMIAALPLMPGSYVIGLFAKPWPGYWGSAEHSLDFVERASVFDVEPITVTKSSILPTGAIVLEESQWDISSV